MTDYRIISMDIPMRPGILRAFAADFQALADELDGAKPSKPAPVPAVESHAISTEAPEIPATTVADRSATPVLPETAQNPMPANPSEATEHPADVPLDAEGLPWDSRIHASSKAKNKGDGAWRLKRGIDDARVQQVKNELKAAMGAPPAPQQQQPQITPEPSAGSVFGAQEQAAPPPPPQEPAAGNAPQNYAEFMSRVAAIPSERVNAVLQGLGLPSAALLSTRPDLIPAAWLQLQGDAQ